MDYLEKIRQNNGQIEPDWIDEIIDHYKDKADEMKRMYDRYKVSQDGVPIFKRSPADYEDIFERARNAQRIDDKVNNVLANAFESDIADTATGYFAGVPISYGVEGDDKVTKTIEEFNLRNHTEDKDAEWAKKAIICGRGARLAYVDKDGKECIKNINPWQVIFLGDAIEEPEYSLRHYKDSEGVNHAEFYNERYVYYYKQDSGKYKEESVRMNDGIETSKQEHLFSFNPLFGLSNNEEQQSDFYKVLTLIDAYNRTLSDASNEIEQFRLAYLVWKGVRNDDDADMKRVREIELLGENDDVKYLTKDINDALIEHHLDRLENNILKYSKTIDFSDESFGGTVTGPAMRYKIMKLENKCITKERKMTAALRYQFKVLCSAWEVRGVAKADDYLKTRFTFTRNLPEDLLAEAEATARLKGNVSEETRLSKLSFIDNPEEELKRMEEDRLNEFDQYNATLGKVGDSKILDKPKEPKISPKPQEKDNTCPKCHGTGKIDGERKEKIICTKCGGDGVVT